MSNLGPRFDVLTALITLALEIVPAIGNWTSILDLIFILEFQYMANNSIFAKYYEYKRVIMGFYINIPNFIFFIIIFIVFM